MGPRTAAALSLFISGATGVACWIVLAWHLEAVLGRPGAGLPVLLATSVVAAVAGAALVARAERMQARRFARLGELEMLVGLLLWAAVPGMRALLDALSGTGRPGAVLAGAALLWLPFVFAMGVRLALLAGAARGQDREQADRAPILVAMLALGAALGSCIWALWTLPGFDLTGSLAAAGSVQLATGLAIRAQTQARAGASSEPTEPSGAEVARPKAAYLLCFACVAFAGVGASLVLRLPVAILAGGTLPGVASAAALAFLGIALGIVLCRTPGSAPGSASGSASGSARASHRGDRATSIQSFAWLQLSLGVCLGAVVALLPDLPFLQLRLAGDDAGAAGLARSALLFVPIALIPGALLGAAFAVALRAVASGRPSWLAAVTAGSVGAVLAGLVVGFAGDARLGLGSFSFAVVLCICGVGALLLSSERRSGAAFAGALAGLLLLGFGQGAVSIKPMLLEAPDPGLHGSARDSAQLLVIDGPGGQVSIEETPDGRRLRTDGLVTGETRLSPPYLPASDFWIAVAPYLLSARPERALMLDLAGGSSAVAMLETSLPSLEIVDPRPELTEAVPLLHQGRSNPLSNPRVSFAGRAPRLALRARLASGFLVDVLTSHPRHVWRTPDASRLTRSFFDLARENLREGGVFASTLPLERMEADTALSVIAHFEAGLPGAFVLDVSEAADRSALLLLGSTAPLRVDPAELRRRMAEPALARSLARYGVATPEDLLARIEGPAAGFALRAPSPPLRGLRAELDAALASSGSALDFARLAGDPAMDGPLLPELASEPDYRALALAVARRGQGAKLSRLLSDSRTRLPKLDRGLAQSLVALKHPDTEAAALAQLERLAREHPDDVSALRASALHLATRRGRFEAAAALFGQAFERSGAGRDAFDAARAWDRIDPSRALEWVQRIPRDERPAFARIALYEARGALRARRAGAGPDAAELTRLLAALTEYRRSAEGRRLHGVAAVLADLAEAAGRPRLAAIHAEADRSERSRRLEALLARVRVDLAESDFDGAAQRIAQAGQVAPGSPLVIEMEARLAAARGDEAGAARALDVLRIHAATPEQAIARENALRRELGLPLLPLFALDEILAAGS